MRADYRLMGGVVLGVALTVAYLNVVPAVEPQGAIATIVENPAIATEALDEAAWQLRAGAGVDPEIGVMQLTDAQKVELWLQRQEAENAGAIAQALGRQRIIERAKELGQQ